MVEGKACSEAKHADGLEGTITQAMGISAKASTARPRTPLTAATTNSLGMPLVGFGTFQLSAKQAATSVCAALTAGYRHVDSAQGYDNEEGTGRGIVLSGVPRDQIFVTTKLFGGYSGWGAKEKTFDDTLEALKGQLKQLQLDFVDLYLIHTPLSGERLEQWRALVELRRLGLAKHIGVSNYGPAHLQEIADAGLPPPEANQVECHPLCAQPELTQLMRDQGIAPIAYSSLAPLATWRTGEGQGGDKSDSLRKGCEEVVARMAERLGVSEARLLLRWGLQHEGGYAVLTKSCNPERIRSNLDLFSFEIGDDDMKTLGALNQDRPVAWLASGLDPMTEQIPLASTRVYCTNK